MCFFVFSHRHIKGSPLPPKAPAPPVGYVSSTLASDLGPDILTDGEEEDGDSEEYDLSRPLCKLDYTPGRSMDNMEGPGKGNKQSQACPQTPSAVTAGTYTTKHTHTRASTQTLSSAKEHTHQQHTLMSAQEHTQTSPPSKSSFQLIRTTHRQAHNTLSFHYQKAQRCLHKRPISAPEHTQSDMSQTEPSWCLYYHSPSSFLFGLYLCFYRDLFNCTLPTPCHQFLLK